MLPKLLSWLVGCFRLLREYFSLYQTVSKTERGKKKREMIDEREKCPNNLHPHLLRLQQALARLLSKISRTPLHWKFTQHHRTTRPPLSCWVCKKDISLFLFVIFVSRLCVFNNYRNKVCSLSCRIICER